MASDKDMNSVASNIRLIKLLTEVSNKDPENSFLLNLYKRHGKYTPESLVQEIRDDASNTLLRPFMGSPNYDKVVRLVADKMGLKKKELVDDEAKNELLIIRKMLQDYLKKHPEAEEKLNALVKEMGEEYNDFVSLIFTGSAAAFFAAIDAIGPTIVAQIVLRILLTFAGVQTALIAARVAALLVPFLNIFMSVWLVASIAGPAYRKIVPSVIDIALLRLQQKQEGASV